MSAMSVSSQSPTVPTHSKNPKLGGSAVPTSDFGEKIKFAEMKEAEAAEASKRGTSSSQSPNFTLGILLNSIMGSNGAVSTLI